MENRGEVEQGPSNRGDPDAVDSADVAVGQYAAVMHACSDQLTTERSGSGDLESVETEARDAVQGASTPVRGARRFTRSHHRGEKATSLGHDCSGDPVDHRSRNSPPTRLQAMSNLITCPELTRLGVADEPVLSSRKCF